MFNIKVNNRSLFPGASNSVFTKLNKNTSGKTTAGFYNFLLQNVQENFSENVQVVKTLADNYITFALGQNPPIFTYSGTLINTVEDDWRMDFLELYQSYLRASKLAKVGGNVGSETRVINTSILKYDSVFVYGTMLGFNMSMNANNELAVPFSFQYLVREVKQFIQDPNAAALPEDPEYVAQDFKTKQSDVQVASNASYTSGAPTLGSGGVSAAAEEQTDATSDTADSSTVSTITVSG